MWTPYLGERLSLCADVGNAHDCCAVSVMKEGEVVGHIQRLLCCFSDERRRGGGTHTKTPFAGIVALHSTCWSSCL